MMGKIYLIGQTNDSNIYKIGRTKHPKASDRIPGLQTGNPDELYVVREFETDKPAKLEAMLHRNYKHKNVMNEWFELSDEDVIGFLNECDKYQKIMDCLKDNPFFK